MATVLCLDNSETIRKVVKDCVLDLGFDFLEAMNGKDGLAVLENNTNIDLIVLDWNMPVMSGVETLKAIKSVSEWSHIKVLAVIKIENRHRVVEAIDMGVDNYILKPFPVNKMQEKIAEMITNAG